MLASETKMKKVQNFKYRSNANDKNAGNAEEITIC